VLLILASCREIEAAVISQIRTLLGAPEIIAATWRIARASIGDLTQDDVREALGDFQPLWDELFPAEQARFIHLLVEQISIRSDGAEIKLRTEGLAGLFWELRGTPDMPEAA
jgi:site-specific DNA recombinase